MNKFDSASDAAGQDDHPRLNDDAKSQRLIHELQVHQVELKLQNHALLETCEQLEQSLKDYTELYDFAPVGYFTLGADGKIRKVNLTGATLLGQERAYLINKRFGLFVSAATRAIFKAFLSQTLTGASREHCEIVLAPEDTPPCDVYLEGIGLAATRDRCCHIAVIDITARKQTETALRASEAFNTTILNSLTESVVVLDALGVIIKVNTAWKQFAENNGTPELARHSVGLSYRDICLSAAGHPEGETAAAAWAGIEAVLQGRQDSFTLEYPCDSPEAVRWFRMHVYPLANQHQGVVILHENITERKQHEEWLRLSEARYTAIVEGQTDLVCRFLPEGVLTFANAAYCHYFGCSCAEILGSNLMTLIPAHSRAFVAAQIAACNADHPINTYEHQVWRADGEARWIQWTDHAILDDNRMLMELQSVGRDITEQRRLEVRLRESEAHYRLLFEAANDGIVFHTMEPDGSPGRFLHVNAMVRRLLGYTPDEMMRLTPLDIQDAADLAAVPKEAQELRDTGNLLFEKTLIGKDGRRAPVEIHARIFESAGQRMVLSIIRDISERKHAEAALRASEKQFRQLFASMNTGFALHEIIVDDQGYPRDYRFLKINPAFEQMTGLSAATLIGKTVRQALPNIESAWIEIYGQVALTGESAHFENHAAAFNKTFEVIAYCPQKGQFACLFNDITERKQMEAALREMATTDELTGLANRRHFMARLQEEYARLQRHDTQQAAVLMLDLDYFKRINDNHGHAAGDAVLRHFAALVRQDLRKIDTAGRVGGEEFALILPGADLNAAQVFAERLRRKVAESSYTHATQTIPLTVSIGIAVVKANDLHADAALIRADQALYRAKQQGRNRVSTADKKTAA